MFLDLISLVEDVQKEEQGGDVQEEEQGGDFQKEEQGGDVQEEEQGGDLASRGKPPAFFINILFCLDLQRDQRA